MTVMWYSLLSKICCVVDCNSNSQNKIIHTNHNNNMHRLRQGMTFAVYMKELVVSRSTLSHTYMDTNVPLESIWKV